MQKHEYFSVIYLHGWIWCVEQFGWVLEYCFFVSKSLGQPGQGTCDGKNLESPQRAEFAFVRTLSISKKILYEFSNRNIDHFASRAAQFVECSALERENMAEVFEEAVRAALRKKPVTKRTCQFLWPLLHRYVMELCVETWRERGSYASASRTPALSCLYG